MNRKFMVVFSLIVMLYFLVPSPSFADELTVGNGQGQPWPFPSYNDREVVISLNNSAEVTSMEMDICDDVEDYLKAVDCTFTTRQVGGDCTCVATEPSGDCAIVSFVGTDCSILPGTDPIFTLIYDVRPGAPLQECRDLNPQDVTVNGSPFTGQLTSGEFCFVCVANEDCISSNPNFCWDQFCNLDSQDPDYGTCYSEYGLSCPDDGLYCNGLESCDSVEQECHHEYTSPETICNHPGSPLPLLCDDGLELCYCDDDAQCSDGLNCTGVETCDTGGSYGICQPGVPFCEEPTPVCDEGPPTQCYVEDVTLTVEDGSGFPGATTRYYLDYDSGTSGFNVGATLTALYSGTPRGSGVIKKVTGNDTAGTLELESFLGEVYNNFEITDDGDPAGSAYADGGLYHYYPVREEVSLSNPYDNVVSISMNIYDEGDYLSCTGCDPVYVPEGRCSTNCTCEAFEQDGFCHVALACFDCGLGGCSYWPISTGDGPVLTVYYDVSEEIPPGCINLDPEVELVQTWLGGDALGDLWALPVPGEFCDQCKGDFDCDTAVGANDVTTFLEDFGRNLYNNICETEDPCNGDFDCDTAVGANDVTTFLEDFGRNLYNNPCAACTEPFYCIYE